MISTKISELFTVSTNALGQNWNDIIALQQCSYLNRKCIKSRKSQPEISIGTCTVKYGNNDVIICPKRLLEKRQIFIDCLHLLTLHEPGNEIHIIQEVSIPGGSIDYILVSVKDNKVRDFVGIELQTLDTTGTVWPERQRFLKSMEIEVVDSDSDSIKPYGMNWKMTAKTILIQLHHKIETFEHLSKHLVLIVQDCLIEYMQKEFSFSEISKNAKIGESLHFHSYQLRENSNAYHLNLNERMSTDSVGLAKCLGLKAEANIELDLIIKILESKINTKTLFTI